MLVRDSYEKYERGAERGGWTDTLFRSLLDRCREQIARN